MPQQSQRLRRELNSHEAAKPRIATAALRISRTHDLPDQQRKNYLAPSWLPELYWLRQTLVGVSSASRRARSACRRPLSVSLSAHRHPNAGGFAQPRRWRRDDCHHAGGSRRVSLRQRRQRNLGARKAGTLLCPVLPNPSLEARPNIKTPGPRNGLAHFPPRGPGVLLSVPPQLER